MILTPHTRTMLLRRAVRAPGYSHSPTLPVSVRVLNLSQRAVSGSSKNKEKPLGKLSNEVPIIGSDGKGLFESLGITGRLKMVAMAIFIVLATIESMFWASMIWK
jgi:hypothetical protein